MRVYSVLSASVYILTAKITDGTVNDSRIGGSMLGRLPRLEGHVFDADRGYDSNRNCMLAYERGMKPNIKQRKTGGANKELRFRKKPALEFDVATYHFQGLMEDVYGALEAGAEVGDEVQTEADAETLASGLDCRP